MVSVSNACNGQSRVARSLAPRIPPVALDHEEFVVRRGRAQRRRLIVAVHSTVLGPALGGLRMWALPGRRSTRSATPCGSPPG